MLQQVWCHLAFTNYRWRVRLNVAIKSLEMMKLPNGSVLLELDQLV